MTAPEGSGHVSVPPNIEELIAYLNEHQGLGEFSEEGVCALALASVIDYSGEVPDDLLDETVIGDVSDIEIQPFRGTISQMRQCARCALGMRIEVDHARNLAHENGGRGFLPNDMAGSRCKAIGSLYKVKKS